MISDRELLLRTKLTASGCWLVGDKSAGRQQHHRSEGGTRRPRREGLRDPGTKLRGTLMGVVGVRQLAKAHLIGWTRGQEASTTVIDKKNSYHDPAARRAARGHPAV